VTWRWACHQSDVRAGRGWPATVNGQPIAVFSVDGELHAVDNVCRHIGSPLDDGVVEDGCVICPWHGWRYRLSTGDQVTVFGTRRGLNVYPVRADGDDIYVDVGP
jgi:nitrite reductase/ring-hydroxylating ferredoxin subunit